MRKEFSIFCTFAYNSVHLIREFKRSKESLGERLHIRVTEIHFMAYQWLMMYIKGLEMSKILSTNSFHQPLTKKYT